MFCPRCGNNVSAEDKFCRTCGNAVASAAAPPSPPVAGPPVPAQTSGKAIASLAFGLFLFAFPLSIVAVILGHLSLSEIRKSAGRLKGEGMAIAGLVLGYLGVAGIPVILIIAAIAIPNLLRARTAANEASAAASERSIVVAEIGYLSAYPANGYAALAQLGGATPCTPAPATACLIDNNLATNVGGNGKSGYIFDVTPGGSALDGWNFYTTAVPVSNATGSRSFCATEDGVIRREPPGTITAATSYADCMSLTPLNN